MKSGNLNFLEPSGALQACNGTALPSPFTVYLYAMRAYGDWEVKINKFLQYTIWRRSFMLGQFDLRKGPPLTHVPPSPVTSAAWHFHSPPDTQ
jgi:hypothetical protein